MVSAPNEQPGKYLRGYFGHMVGAWCEFLLLVPDEERNVTAPLD